MKKTLFGTIAGSLLLVGAATASEFDKAGFVTEIEDGRLWVFKVDSEELKQFHQYGEPAKQFTQIGAGPNGMTVKAANIDVLNEYLTAPATSYNKEGFVTEVEDGRLWVFKANSDELKHFQEYGEPAKQFTQIGAGPNGMTVKAANIDTLTEYLSKQ